MNLGKLHPDQKAAWVAALRSGKYKQGQNRMLNTALGGWSYCCLAVKCAIDGKTTKEMENLQVPIESWADSWWEVKPDIAITPHNPEVFVQLPNKPRPCYVDLAGLNDAYNFTFEQIADLIEEQL